jgi:hypothetical protein
VKLLAENIDIYPETLIDVVDITQELICKEDRNYDDNKRIRNIIDDLDSFNMSLVIQDIDMIKYSLLLSINHITVELLDKDITFKQMNFNDEYMDNEYNRLIEQYNAVASLIDMGGRFRLIIQDVECVKPIMKMPNLPVARVMWRAMPDLTTGLECWIIAGGAHHTVLSMDVTAEQMTDWARMMDIECVHITKDTTPEKLEHDLLVSDLIWKLK